MRQPTDSFILLLALSLVSLPILAARTLRATNLPPESLCLEPGSFNLIFNITDYYLQYVADELKTKLPAATESTLANISDCTPAVLVNPSLCHYENKFLARLYAPSSNYSNERANTIAEATNAICATYLDGINRKAMIIALSIVVPVIMLALGAYLYKEGHLAKAGEKIGALFHMKPQRKSRCCKSRSALAAEHQPFAPPATRASRYGASGPFRVNLPPFPRTQRTRTGYMELSSATPRPNRASTEAKQPRTIAKLSGR